MVEGRKLITLHKALHPRYDTDCKYQEKKEEEDSPALKIAYIYQRLEDYIRKNKGRLIIVNRCTNNTRINRTKISRKQK